MKVGRDRADAGQAEIEIAYAASVLPEEGQDPAADTGVDMEPDPGCDRQLRDRVDRVDHTVRIAGGGADQKHRPIVDQPAHGLYVHAAIRVQGRTPQLEIHHVGRLVEGGMGRIGHDDVERAVVPAPMLRTVGVAGGLDGQEDAFASAAGKGAGRAVRSLEEVQSAVEHLLLHPADAEKGPRSAERVLREEVEIGIAPDLLGLLVVEEHEQRRAAAPPVDIGARESLHLGLQRLPVLAAGGEWLPGWR